MEADSRLKSEMMHSNNRARLGCSICLALATVLMGQPITVPAGLPAWTFNVPDTIQPAAVRPEGIVRAKGSAKQYDAAKIAGNANPPDWFPEEHGPAPRSVRGDTG